MKIEKIQIESKSRKLAAKWTVEYQDTSIINIQDELVKTLSDEIAKEIDFGFLADIYTQSGWTEIKFTPSGRYFEIDAWCKENTAGVHGYGSRWLFKDEKDITMFILRWSSD